MLINYKPNNYPVIEGGERQFFKKELQRISEAIGRLISGDANPVTVAELTPVGTVGRKAFVTDATVTTFASVVAGGGANGVPVYDDGTNWRIG